MRSALWCWDIEARGAVRVAMDARQESLWASAECCRLLNG